MKDILSCIKESQSIAYNVKQEKKEYKSTDKMIPYNVYINDDITKIMKDINEKDYEIYGKGIEKNKEYKFKGKRRNKNIDIALLKRSTKTEMVLIEEKNPLSCLAKNLNNYSQNQVGQTVDIKKTCIATTVLFLVIEDELPIFKEIKENGKKKEIICGYDKLTKQMLKPFFYNSDDTYNCSDVDDITAIFVFKRKDKSNRPKIGASRKEYNQWQEKTINDIELTNIEDCESSGCVCFNDEEKLHNLLKEKILKTINSGSNLQRVERVMSKESISVLCKLESEGHNLDEVILHYDQNNV